MLPRRFSILIGLVLVLVVGSCAPAATPTTAPTKPPAKAEKIKLVVADQFTEAGYGPLADKIYKEYMAKHPNIEIEHNIIQLNDPTIKTALVSGTGPDLIYFDTGPGYAGKLIEAEVLLPLDEYAKQYGWDTKIFKWARDRASANGKLYGLGLEMEFLGVFYNKELFEKEGWKVPETDQETLEYCAKAKAKGYIPFAYGDRPGWQAFHQFGMVVNNVLGIEAAGKLFFENQGKWTQPDIVKATKFFFVDMLKAGCFMPDVTAVEYNDSNMAFFTGKAPMLNTGTWIIDDINKNAKDFTPQMVPFPSIGGKDRILPAGLGSAWYISSKSKYQKEAAELLNYVFSDEVVKMWYETGVVVPVKMDANVLAGLKLTALDKFAIDILQKAAQGQGGVQLGYYVDTAAPEAFNTMMQDGFQAVLLGSKTVEQQLEDLQRLWDEGQKK